MIQSSRLTGSARCLRCQLREVLFRSRRECDPSTPRKIRQFSCNTLLGQQAQHNGNHGGVKWKHVYTEGRIIERNGRRHRVDSRSLPTASLNKPSSIVILSDVHRSSASAAKNPVGKTNLDGRTDQDGIPVVEPARLQNGILEDNATPSEADIIASLESLRPTILSMGGAQYEKLAESLLRAYSTVQLRQYADRFNTSATQKEEDTKSLPWTWRKSTALSSKRRASIADKRGAKLSGKRRAAERVLRKTWKIVNLEEEQEVGEAELRLQPWMKSMLFDVQSGGKPMWLHLLNSRLLASATKVTFGRRENVLRVHGRRDIAEEVVARLSNALDSMHKVVLDIKQLRSILLGNGLFSTIEDVMEASDLKYISNLTQASLHLEDNMHITIRHPTLEGANTARRMLLSFIGAQEPETAVQYITPQIAHGEASNKLTLPKAVKMLPILDTSTGLHRRLTRLSLQRAAAVVSAPPQQSGITLKDTLPTNGLRTSKQVVQTICKFLASPVFSASGKSVELEAGSLWDASRGAIWTPWIADYCRILHPQDALLTNKRGTSLTSSQIVQHYVPNITSMLGGGRDHRVRHTKSTPTLIVHFWPPPTQSRQCNETKSPPRIEIHLQAGQGGKLNLVKMLARLDSHRLDVALPSYACDMQFKRDLVMTADIEVARNDVEVAKIVDGVQESIKSDHPRQLSTEANVSFPLPRSVLNTDKIEHGVDAWMQYDYVLAKFEQVDALQFPLKGIESVQDEAAVTLSSPTTFTAKDYHLTYSEIDAGAVDGRSTILSLCSSGRATDGKNIEQEVSDPVDGNSETDVESLVSAALHTADLLSHTVGTAQSSSESRQYA